MKQELFQTDTLIIGSGIAGGIAALTLANLGHQVILVSKSSLPQKSNTFYAQGGIIYQGDHDSPTLLAKDINEAGTNLNNPKAVAVLTQDGPVLVKKILLDLLKVPFDKHHGRLALTKEGGHSLPRIIHQTDATGKAIENTLIAKLKKNKRIKMLSHLTAIDLITSAHKPRTCLGAYFLDNEDERVNRITAKDTILATGGLGQIYQFTTNPEGARGDGIAMASRSGAKVINLEYVQFHPTALFHPNAPRFLISEAVRGEGARLVNRDGVPFMSRYNQKWQDLAPRDVVSRAIYQEMQEKGTTNVYLDLKSYLSPEKIKTHFPNLYQACLNYNVDMTKDLVPVVPAAHYHCGGVRVDENGQTSLKNLHAVGEVACTGLHGSNRLASTSLLEGLVWGYRAARDIHQGKTPHFPNPSLIPMWTGQGKENPNPISINQNVNLVRQTMWNYVGLVRSTTHLSRAKNDLTRLNRKTEELYQKTKLSEDLIGLRNISLVARLIAAAAWENKNSAGCHYRIN